MFSTKTDYDYKLNVPLYFDTYKVIEFIDNGMSSAVVKIQDQNSKQYYAAKIISKRDMKKKHLLKMIYNEIRILSSIDHPNIIKILDTFEIQNKYDEDFIVIIEEYCKNGNIIHYINERGFKNHDEKIKIASELVDALQYLHEKGIAHCDVKPDNVLIDDNHSAKLCDFGFSLNVKNTSRAKRWGTIGYNSPELYKKGFVDFIKCDIWALGITLYAMSEDELPYTNDKEAEKCILQMKTNDDLLRSVVNKCTTSDPKQRPNAKELLGDIFFSLYDGCFNEEKINEMRENVRQKNKTNQVFVHGCKQNSSFNLLDLNSNSSTSFLFKSDDSSYSYHFKSRYNSRSLISLYSTESAEYEQQSSDILQNRKSNI